MRLPFKYEFGLDRFCLKDIPTFCKQYFYIPLRLHLLAMEMSNAYPDMDLERNYTCFTAHSYAVNNNNNYDPDCTELHSYSLNYQLNQPWK